MPTKTHSTVVAIFRNPSDAQVAVSDLKANGFSANDIFLSNDTSAVDATEQPGGVYAGDTAHSHGEHEHGIVGWFKSVFGQDEHADRSYYEDAVNTGHTFLSVDVTDESIDKAASLINAHNPIDVHREDDAAEVGTGDPLAKVPPTGAVPAYGAGSTTGSTTAGRIADTESGAIPVVQEELKVGKRAVLKGGVRVYSRMVEEPVEETVRLHDEKVRVDRTPVNRAATPADLTPGREQVFEVKEFAEEAVVSKTARVVEEVRVHKDETERTETVRDSVRHTEVNVESVAPGSTTGATTAAGLTGTGAGVNDEDFRRDFSTRYPGENYDTYRPGYAYGYEMANDPRYRDRSFDEVESDLRSDYARRYPNSTWDRTKDAVRYGWAKVTRKV